MKEFEAQAAELAKAGVPFGFSSGAVKTKDIRENIGRMIKAGLTEDQALAALTTSPAKLLGVSDLMGTVEKGKIANLVVTDKPYFAEKSNVRYVFVDGMPTEYEVKKKKAKKPVDPNAEVTAIGTWTIVIQLPGDGNTGVIVLEGSNSNLSGTITIQGEEQELIDPTLDGNVLTFAAKFAAGGQNIAVSSEVTIDGDNFEGTIEASGMGSFGVEGERTSSPE
ncbi:MAG: amidohydrolase family protein [Bacteroidota bacterium]